MNLKEIIDYYLQEKPKGNNVGLDMAEQFLDTLVLSDETKKLVRDCYVDLPVLAVKDARDFLDEMYLVDTSEFNFVIVEKIKQDSSSSTRFRIEATRKHKDYKWITFHIWVTVKDNGAVIDSLSSVAIPQPC